MAIVVQSNAAFGKAQSECSPRIVKFLNGLTSERLKNLSAFMLADGTCLRVDNENNRTFEQQAKLYEKGRKARWTLVGQGSLLKGVVYALDLTTTDHVTSGWVTNAFSGQSYHNYGLAVDLIWRIDGNNCTKQRFIDTGIVAWAKQCGLAWGGDWANTRGWGPNGDMAHFEDENYRIPVNFTAKIAQRDALLRNVTYSYNPNWVSGHDNFKWICEYNGISYAQEREKILAEGGSSDGLKPSVLDSAGLVLSNSAKNNFNPLLLGIFGGWFLFGRNKK